MWISNKLFCKVDENYAIIGVIPGWRQTKQSARLRRCSTTNDCNSFRCSPSLVLCDLISFAPHYSGQWNKNNKDDNARRLAWNYPTIAGGQSRSLGAGGRRCVCIRPSRCGPGRKHGSTINIRRSYMNGSVLGWGSTCSARVRILAVDMPGTRHSPHSIMLVRFRTVLLLLLNVGITRGGYCIVNKQLLLTLTKYHT